MKILPEGMFKHFLNFLYIADILFGIVILTTNYILMHREDSILLSRLRNFNIVFTLYLTWNYIDFYRSKIIMEPDFSKGLFLLGDILFAALFFFWTDAAAYISQRKSTYRKALGFSSIVFIAAWMSIYLLFFDEEYMNVSLFGSWLAIGVDTVLILMVIIFNILLMKNSSFCRENKSEAKYLYVMNALMFLYLLWYYIWDVGLNFFPDFISTWMEYPLDSINFIFPFACTITLLFFRAHNSELELARASQPESFSQLNVEQAAEKYHLTEREKELVLLVAEGLNNPEISIKMNIANNTVKRHLNNIYKKTGSKNRYELMHMIK